jgi:uncharacterized protein
MAARRRVDDEAMSELDEFRAEKDEFFREHPQSPLTPEQRSSFGGLEYFPENPDLALRTGLITEGVDRQERIVMQTTTGDQQDYHRAGTIEFDIHGERARLTLYASPDMHDLFLPFRDATSGKETYGAGRYLEVDPPDADGLVVVDFNYAYSPSCAYNPNWSCPIPPGENWVTVSIRAGEKTFPGAHEVSVRS